MIEIDLNLFATLAGYMPENSGGYKVPDRSTVEGLVMGLNIPPEEVKLIFVNGRRETIQYRLKQGDRVGLFPPVGGG